MVQANTNRPPDCPHPPSSLYVCIGSLQPKRRLTIIAQLMIAYLLIHLDISDFVGPATIVANS